jgi:ABC-2 type transport system permease protein
MYVVNLRNVSFNFRSVFWETMISYLNLAASALTLSTLTTRFVFPQFSLEGRRLWIIGLAPIGLRKILLQKFWMSLIMSSSMTVTLMVISSLMLHLAWVKVVFFAGSILLLSAALSGLSVGLGALFPNFKEDNPSKIVSGFGGTLCLVASFIYITLFVAFSAFPAVKQEMNLPVPIPGYVALLVAFFLSLSVLFLPLGLALRRLKNMEF